MLRDCFGPCFRLMLRLPDSPPTGRTDVRREAERLLEEAGRLALRGARSGDSGNGPAHGRSLMDETALGIAWKAAPPGRAIHCNAAGGRDGAGTGFSTKSAACLRTGPKMPSWPRSPCVASDSDSEDIFITIPMGSASSTERLPSGSAVRRFRFLFSHPLHICQGKPPRSGMSGLC